MTKNTFLKILYSLFILASIIFVLAFLYDTPFFYQYFPNDKILNNVNILMTSFGVLGTVTGGLILYTNFDRGDISNNKINYYKRNYKNYLVFSFVLTFIFFILNKIIFRIELFNIFIFFYFLFLIPILHILILSIKKEKESFFSKNIFLIALIILSFVPFYLAVDYKQTAEQLSIYVYYFLILGVISSAFEK